MSENQPSSSRSFVPYSRRDFLKTGAAAATTAWLAGCATGQRGTAPGLLHDQHKLERIRVGLIGCGGRGTGAAKDAAAADPQVQIVALGDVFADRVAEARQNLAELGDRAPLTDARCFTGFDAYLGVLASDVDLVILATPPGFRPLHLAAAVAAGKHVFMEKPVAVDPVGVRRVIEASQLAQKRGLGIVCGTQRRHQPAYLAAMKRIHRGDIGEIVAAQCYWNQGELWVKPQEPGWSDMEWQCRNWLYFTWLSGDHIVEQHVHNLDVVNWAMRATPVKCLGMGGRQVRTAPEFGNIFDHFAIEYEYPNGARVLSMCRQMKGTSDRVCERIVGTRGVAYLDGGGIAEITRGKVTWKYDGGEHDVNPYVQEHVDLITSIRRCKPLNEGVRIAESTLTAIMGRESAYTGRELQWSWILSSSKLDLTPPRFELGSLPVAPVAVPGETPLV
jgi:myo-inositol 2-dehydrogenase / D-chiro-inositol 1-dehydrogenase